MGDRRAWPGDLRPLSPARRGRATTRRFFVGAALAAAGTLGGTAALGRAIDPFGFHLPEGEPHRPQSSDGLDRRPAYALDRGLIKLVELDRIAAALPPEHHLRLILGDSVAMQIDARVLNRRLDGLWHNLAYGGASIVENLDLLDHLLGRYPITAILWNVSLARLREGGADRIARTVAMARNPWRHHLTAQSLAAVVMVAGRSWLGIEGADQPEPVAEADLPTWMTARQRIEHLAADWPDEVAPRLAAFVARTRRLGIDFRLLALPMHPELRRMFERELPEREHAFEALLRTHPTLRLDRDGHWAAASYRDALHLRVEHHAALSAQVTEALAGE